MAAGKSLEEIKKDLVATLAPMEGLDKLFIITDERTGARYCDCHVRGSKFVELATPDAPLDPDEQGDYRANRDVVSNAPAFAKMKSDAKARRSFSGIVAEYSHEMPIDKPLLIIGGQHRYHAIKEALESGVDEWHGVKIYLDLTTEQRLDAQLISNTVIAISSDLFDRMHETVTGPQLRDWCQSVGLLDPGEDFADRKSRGAVTVQTARTFIASYYAGTKVPSAEFDGKETFPPITVTGQHDIVWDAVKAAQPNLWTDAELKRAGQEFARLAAAQRKAFEGKKPKPPVDYPEKASNMALLAAWAFVAGVLRNNAVRLQRHYALADANQLRRMARPAPGVASSIFEPPPVNEHATLPAAVKRVSKQDLILDLMHGEGGASLTAVVAATGWLPHTARAALTGLRKKGHTIEKSKVDGETRYLVKAGAAQ